MPAKVRVYELARELDVTNKEIIALCESLGIDAKSHSSSLVEAQADRVRKKAISDGIATKKSAEKAELKYTTNTHPCNKPLYHVQSYVKSKGRWKKQHFQRALEEFVKICEQVATSGFC